MQVPQILPNLVITDNAQLAAEISCVLARPRAYVPVAEAPRMMRPDRDAEVVRRNNAAGRAKPELVLLAGLADEAADAIENRFVPSLRAKIKRVS